MPVPRLPELDPRLRDHRPEPANLWIRHTAVLPPPAGPVWVDLAAGELGGAQERAAAGGRQRRPVDLVYLPPSPDEDRREELVRWCESAGIPTLVQHVLADGTAPLAGEHSTLAVDPLGTLLSGSLDLLETVPANGLVVWPLVAGLTDEPGLLEQGLQVIRARGVKMVVPFPLRLTPAAGRRLTDAFGERLFEALFHAGEVDLAPVAKAIHDHGFDVLPPRPHLPGAVSSNRWLATELATVAELYTVSAASPAAAQEFFRAASWIERTHHDVAALARDGNLGIVPSLSSDTIEVIEELTGGAERSTLLIEMVRRYVAGDP